jgi:hypothetical protein
VEKMIHKNCFKELSGEEMMQLAETSHNFAYYNWVHNSSSSSTPFRMISNTSSVSTVRPFQQNSCPPAMSSIPKSMG